MVVCLYVCVSPVIDWRLSRCTSVDSRDLERINRYAADSSEIDAVLISQQRIRVLTLRLCDVL